MTFQRFIGIDWSGAATDDQRVSLRVVASGPLTDGPTPITPPTSRRAKNWSRQEVLDFLRTELGPDAPPTLVAIDAAIGYPRGTGPALFDAHSFEALSTAVARGLQTHGTAAHLIDALNQRATDAQLPGVPFFYRGKDLPQRPWHRPHHRPHAFFTHLGISYYRLVETLVPESLSPFYIGPGPTVAYHALTVLHLVHGLQQTRHKGLVDVGFWPLESNWSSRRHLIAECYPSILPTPKYPCPSANPHQRDAHRIADWLHHLPSERLQTLLDLRPHSDDASSPSRSIARKEGWILGVDLPVHHPFSPP